MSLCFQSADFLLPETGKFENWAVIACDQHTSEPAYWQQVREKIGTDDSTLNIIMPEAELHMMDQSKIQKIADTMRTYADNGVLEEYPSCYVYV